MKKQRPFEIPKFKDLKIIRVFSFDLIPPYLFEQVKGRSWSVDGFLRDAPVYSSSPTNLIFVFADKDHIIQGFLWATVNVFTKNIDGQVLSLNKKYWFKGAIRYAIDFLKILRTQLGLKKICFRTSRPKAFERLVGAKRSPRVIMEI